MRPGENLLCYEIEARTKDAMEMVGCDESDEGEGKKS